MDDLILDIESIGDVHAFAAASALREVNDVWVDEKTAMDDIDQIIYFLKEARQAVLEGRTTIESNTGST